MGVYLIKTSSCGGRQWSAQPQNSRLRVSEGFWVCSSAIWHLKVFGRADRESPKLESLLSKKTLKQFKILKAHRVHKDVKN